jgi:Arc/MetJ-type ribon-helix-helix transcriptional regulator
MQVRVLNITRNGKHYSYAQLVESYRRESDGMPMHRIIRNLGPADSVEVHNLREALSAARKGKRVVLSPAAGPSARALPKILANLRYLDAAVLLALWDEWQLTQLIDDVLPRGSADVAPASVLAALTMQRGLDPGSKLYATRWFPKSALPELLHVSAAAFNNSRVHRVLDGLDVAGSTLMGKLAARYGDRDGAFVSLFLDTTDTWFVGHGPELAERAKTKEGRVERKVGIVLLCNQLGYPLRWEVIAGRESEVTAMSRMVGLVAGLSWAQKVPLVSDRAMGRTAQLREMLRAQVHFVTALTTTEYDAYTGRIPYQTLADFKLHPGSEQQDMEEAARLVEAAGLERVDDRLFVADLGIVQRVEEDFAEKAAPASEHDAQAKVMQLARSIDEAVAAGRYASQASAGRALDLSKQLASRYRLLRRLPESVQQQIIGGEARGRSLEDLIRIARLGDAQAQCEAFARLAASAAPRRASARPLGVSASAPRSSNSAGTPPTPQPIRVRAVVYFNPQLFVDHRRRASEQLEAIAAFTDDLNTRLANPRSRMARDQIAAAIDRRLRKDDLLGAFIPQITEQIIAERPRYQVKLPVNQPNWSRRRRHDGFNVVVAHPELQRTATELAQLYRAKDAVEKDFQTIKSFVELRPIRHQTDGKVRAHVTICMLALLLERTLHQKLKGKHTAQAALQELEGCRLNRLAAGNDGMAAYALTELTSEQAIILRLLRLQELGDQQQVAARIIPR